MSEAANSGDHKSEKKAHVKADDGNRDNKLAKINRAKENLNFLERLSPLAVWHGSVKEKDLQFKLDKCCKLSEQLTNEFTDEDAHNIAKELYEKMGKIIEWQDTLGDLTTAITSTDPFAKALQLTPQHYAVLRTLAADCLNSILTDFGRKMTEAIYSSFQIQVRPNRKDTALLLDSHLRNRTTLKTLQNCFQFICAAKETQLGCLG